MIRSDLELLILIPITPKERYDKPTQNPLLSFISQGL